jgi:SAM-dependent methyltransferase
LKHHGTVAIGRRRERSRTGFPIVNFRSFSEVTRMKELESDVLRQYQMVNPSRMTVDSPEQWERFVKERVHIFRDRLHLPARVFDGAQVLDMCCGTGEKTAVYATWGATITGVEFNPQSIARLRQLFDDHGLTDRLAEVIQLPVSEWTPRDPPVFDLALSDGAIHHMWDPEASFAKLAASVKPGGFVIIAVGPLPGYEQRTLMRRMIRRFASSVDDAIPLAMRWLPEYMDRAVRLGHRTPETIVGDNFFTPGLELLPIDRVLGWFEPAGLSLYRSWPPLEPDLADPASRDEVNWWKPEYREYLLAKAAHWVYHAEEDAERCKTYFQDARSPEKKACWETERSTIEAMIEAGDREGLERYLPDCAIFGRGPSGVGEWWVVGLRR